MPYTEQGEMIRYRLLVTRKNGIVDKHILFSLESLDNMAMRFCAMEDVVETQAFKWVDDEWVNLVNIPREEW